MFRPGRRLARLAIFVVVAALPLLPAACAGSAPGQADAAALAQRLAAQETRTATLQQQVNALGTAVAQQRAAAVGTPRPTALPTPTPVPAVTGLPVSGSSKGLASAKVTITEYSDYL